MADQALIDEIVRLRLVVKVAEQKHEENEFLIKRWRQEIARLDLKVEELRNIVLGPQEPTDAIVYYPDWKPGKVN